MGRATGAVADSGWLEVCTVRNCVYDGSPALGLGAARPERVGWLTFAREVSRVLFPEEAAAHRRRVRSGKGRQANTPA